jgi:type IV secretory pathway VirB10-like protein
MSAHKAGNEPVGSQDDRSEDEEAGASRAARLWRRVGGLVIGVAAIALIVAGIQLFLSGDDLPAPKKVHEITLLKINPPPPPPPPPPKAPEEKMIEQTPVRQEMPEEKPLDKPKDKPKVDDKKADEPPPGPLALDAKAKGPGDSFNLGGKPGGRGLLGGGGGGGGSRWGWYASIVQQQIEAALRSNAKTRSAVLRIEVRLWADSSGRISRIQLVSSTGNAGTDAVIRNEVLSGITLREPPPKDMPMPMVARISVRRPT